MLYYPSMLAIGAYTCLLDENWNNFDIIVNNTLTNKLSKFEKQTFSI